MSQTQYEKMTQTPVPKLLLKLSIPTILSMLISSVYNMADTAFVGQLGNSASGAVGVVFGFMSILQAVGFMFGQGSGSILSRRLGSKDVDGASVTASTGFFCAFGITLVIEILCFIFMDTLVRILGSTETIAPYAKQYLTYILLAAPFVVTSFTLNNILRYEGKATLGMIGMMSGALLNIALDPLFIFVLDLGISGAALATALSQTISFAILLSMFLRGKTQSHLSIRKVNLKMVVLGDIVGTGLPSMLRQGLQSITTVILNLEAGPYGDAAIAAMSIVGRVSFFIFSIALGIGQGFQPISGFNYGAKKYTRVRKAFSTALISSEVVMFVISVFVFIFARDVVSLFRNDPDVIVIGTRALQLLVAAQIALPLVMMMEMQLQTTGQKFSASILSLLRGGGLFIPCLLIMAWLRGLAGIQEAQPLAQVLSIIPALLYARWFFKRLPKVDEG